MNLPGVLSLSSPSEEASCTASYLCSGHPDAILVIGHALHLEILLGLLKEILSLGPVRDSSIPVVLCVSRCEEARRQGIRIDFHFSTMYSRFRSSPSTDTAGNRWTT